VKATLDVTDLRALVDRVKGAVMGGDKVTPILRCVLLTARHDGLSAVAQDMDGLTIDAVVPATVATAGAVCVPGKLLADFARKMADDADCDIQADGPMLRLTCRRGRYALPTLPAEDFPAFAGEPSGKGVHQARMPAGDLLRLIAGVAYAQSKETTRYYLNGAYLHVRQDLGDAPVLRSVATDGHRLARLDGACPDAVAGAPGVILPRGSVGEILRTLEPLGNAPVEVAWSAHLFRVAAGFVTVTTKLVDGTFPDYDRVIPLRNGPAMEADTAALREAVERVAVLAVKGRVEFHFQRGELVLRARESGVGEAEDIVAVSWDGPALTVGYNARYLTDTLARIVGDRVVFDPGDGLGPAVVRDPAAAGALYVLMPMAVGK